MNLKKKGGKANIFDYQRHFTKIEMDKNGKEKGKV